VCHSERSESLPRALRGESGRLTFGFQRPAGRTSRSLAALGMTTLAVLLQSPTILAAQGPITPETNAERILSGRDTPSHDYDLLHQRIDVRNFNWNTTSFDGKVTTTLVARRPRFDSIVLDMGRRLVVRRVTLECPPRKRCAPQPPLRFARPGDSLVVRLARAAGFRDTVRFTVDYQGKITHGRGLYFFRAEPGRPHRPQQIYSGGGTDGNPYWIPTYGAPHDKATWDLIATVPTGYTVVSNGRLISDSRGRSGVHTVHWKQERPASTYLISIVIAPFTRLADRWRNIPLAYYVYPEDAPRARRLFGMTPDLMEAFTRLTGVKYPWQQYSQATVTDFVGGMENVGATTLVDWLPDERAYLDRPWYRRSLIPHELAHQWFGNLVTTQNWVNYWLNEGFAEFMAGQYWGAKLGRLAEEDYYLDAYREFLSLDRRRRVPLAAYNSNVTHFKGALVLAMLKKHLGADRFWASINRYLTRHAYGNALSDDVRRAVLDATGQNLEWFWGQWVYQAGYPEVVVSPAYDSAAGNLVLTVRQSQVDTAQADSTGLRYVTPLVFRSPLVVRVGTAAGDVRARVQLTQREQIVRIPGLKSPPNMVVFDEANVLLKTLTFEQPTAWLATQLAKDPDLWNRSWVIEQLARRTGDSLAAVALVRAAREADFYRVRAEAAYALGRFPAASASPGLESAARDTSATVRQAAIAALGMVGGDEARALARVAWQQDSSYEVKATALSVLARLDSTDAREVVLSGLRTLSYRDVVQTAAIAAAAEIADSTIIAGLEGVLGDQRLAAVTLAALARRGDTQALSALVRHRDDKRPWVRRWVLEAIEQELEKGG
jgi:aminopeptidase N